MSYRQGRGGERRPERGTEAISQGWNRCGRETLGVAVGGGTSRCGSKQFDSSGAGSPGDVGVRKKRNGVTGTKREGRLKMGGQER